MTIGIRPDEAFALQIALLRSQNVHLRKCLTTIAELGGKHPLLPGPGLKQAIEEQVAGIDSLHAEFYSEIEMHAAIARAAGA